MKSSKESRAQLLIRLLRGSKRFFIFGILCTTMVSLIEMIVPNIISMTVDSIIGDKPLNLPFYFRVPLEALGVGTDALLAFFSRRLWLLAVLVASLALLAGVFRYGATLLNTRGSETLVEGMRNKLFRHLQQLPFRWHNQNQTGDLIQRCTNDVDTVRNFISMQLLSVFRIVILMALSMAFMFSIYPRLTLVSLCSIPLILAYSVLFESKIEKSFFEYDESEGKLSAIAQENLTGVRVVRAFGRERTEVTRFETQNEFCTRLNLRLCRLMSLFWASGDLISGLQIMLVLVLGTVFAVRGEISTGNLIAFLSYNAMLTWPVRELGRVISEMSKAGVSISRVGHILSSEPEQDAPNAVKAPIEGDIRFEDVSFSFDGENQTLEHIDLTIPQGKVVGILGGTGSGKTTLMLLLDKLYAPTGGRITIGGRDIAEIDTAWLRRHIGIVLQEPYLFTGTLAENIGITQAQLDLEQVREAAKIACLDDNVQGFAKGYDTVVGERGVTLSGGQKQRAAIARMLMQHTPIMILDDSLSAVDAETDAKIRAALQRSFGNATVILISHRITTLMQADEIVVLDGGRVSQMGTHETLSQQEGIYRRICRIQEAIREEEAS